MNTYRFIWTAAVSILVTRGPVLGIEPANEGSRSGEP